MRQATALSLFLVGGFLLVGVARGGDSTPAASPGTVTYRVITATHSSSSRKDDPPFYSGSSTASWALAAPSASASNLVTVTLAPVATGGGTVNVRGVFRANAKTNGHAPCTLSASTGTKKYPAAAPGPFQLAIGPDPSSPSRVLVAYGVFVNLFASLSNSYFGTECSTTISGEPSTDTRTVKSIPKSQFGKPRIVIRYSGATTKDKIVYRWSTTFVLQKVA